MENISFQCPECNKSQKVKFDLYDPSDGENYSEEVDCKCGCVFEASIELIIDIDWDKLTPKVIKSGKVKYDVNDTSTWPIEDNPNQLELL